MMMSGFPHQDLIADIIYFGGPRTPSVPCEPKHLEPCKVTAIFIAIRKASSDIAFVRCPHTGFPHMACLINPAFLSENNINQCSTCTGCGGCKALERDKTSGPEPQNTDANTFAPQLIRAVRDAGEFWAAALYIASDSLVTEYDAFLKDTGTNQADRLCKITDYVADPIDAPTFELISKFHRSIYLAINHKKGKKHVVLREHRNIFNTYWRKRVRHLNEMKNYDRHG